MAPRKTIRPVTLKRVIEICSLACETKTLHIEAIAQKLSVSESRAEEIALEVEKMGLLARFDGAFGASRNAEPFIEHFEKDQWEKIHEYFLDNYEFYNDFFQILNAHLVDSKGLTLEEIKEESISRHLSLNQTAIEVLSDWSDRLGTIQRHLYSRRLYAIRSEIELGFFKNQFIKCHRDLLAVQGRRSIFVEIPAIREDICEQLKISRRLFDEKLRRIYLANVGRIELSGAPIVTLAKKSALSERRMGHDAKSAILSPKYEVKKEREGLKLRQKAYYYIAIHDSI